MRHGRRLFGGNGRAAAITVAERSVRQRNRSNAKNGPPFQCPLRGQTGRSATGTTNPQTSPSHLILRHSAIKDSRLCPSAEWAILCASRDLLFTSNTWHPAFYFLDKFVLIGGLRYLLALYPFHWNLFLVATTFPAQGELRLGYLATLQTLPIFSQLRSKKTEIGLNLQCFRESVIIFNPKLPACFQLLESLAKAR